MENKLLDKIKEVKMEMRSLTDIFIKIYQDRLFGEMLEVEKVYDYEDVFSLARLSERGLVGLDVLDSIIKRKLILPTAYRNNSPSYLIPPGRTYLSGDNLRSDRESFYDDCVNVYAMYLTLDKSTSSKRDVEARIQGLETKFIEYFLSLWVREDLKRQCFDYYLNHGEVIEYAEFE